MASARTVHRGPARCRLRTPVRPCARRDRTERRRYVCPRKPGSVALVGVSIPLVARLPVVKYQPNVCSGGQISHTDIGQFLRNGASGRERQALLKLIGYCSTTKVRKGDQADHLSSSRRASSSLKRSATSAARSGSSVLAMGLPPCFLIFRPSAVTGKSSGFSGFLEVDITSSSCASTIDSTPSNEPRKLLIPEGSRPISSISAVRRRGRVGCYYIAGN
jgi:hypothetical protein